MIEKKYIIWNVFIFQEKIFKMINILTHLMQATTAGILTTLSHCVEVMNQREESFRRRLEREAEKRKRLEEKLKHALAHSTQETQASRRVVVMGGPDYEVCEKGDLVMSIWNGFEYKMDCLVSSLFVVT